MNLRRFGVVVEIGWAVLVTASVVGCTKHVGEEPPTVLLLAREGRVAEAMRADYALIAERLTQKWAVRVEARSIALDSRLRVEQLAELSRARPTAVVAAPMALAREVQQQHPTLPIVFEGSGDPIELCLVDSLMRPGRSATGRTLYSGDFDRQARALASVFPAATQWFVVVDGTHSVEAGGCDSQQAAVKSSLAAGCDAGPLNDELVAADAGFSSIRTVALRHAPSASVVGTCSVKGLLAWIETLAGRQDVAVMMVTSQFLLQAPKQVIESLNAARVPAAYDRRQFIALGAPLAAVPRDESQRVRTLTELVEVILRGVPPGELPVRVPASIDVILNVAAVARAGWKPDARGLLQVDEFVR